MHKKFFGAVYYLGLLFGVFLFWECIMHNLLLLNCVAAAPLGLKIFGFMNAGILDETPERSKAVSH